MESVSDSSGYLVVAPILVDDWAFRTLTHAGAAIDHKGGTCYVAGGVGGQEEDGVDYFFGLAGAGEWEGWRLTTTKTRDFLGSRDEGLRTR